jgi:hypothetical protein
VRPLSLPQESRNSSVRPRPIRRALHVVAPIGLSLGLSLAGCSGVSVFSSPEGNLSFGAPRANAGGASGPGGRMRDQGDPPPPPHVARSAFDRWRPADVGILPATSLRERPATPVRVGAGPLEFTLRLADARAPAWGGDTYIRVDVRAQGTDQRPTRDLAVLLDTRDEPSLRRARRMAAELFETLREGDRGALLTTDDGGRVRVPLLSYGAAPLLIARSRAVEPRGDDDLAQAIDRGVQLLSHRSDRIVKLAVLSGYGGLVSGEAIAAMSRAQELGVEVVLVPLNEPAAHRFDAASLRSGAVTTGRVAANERAEREAVEELATLPPAEPVAQEVSLAYEALPSPSHLLDVYGGASAWTPSGGDVPLGSVRPGDARTIVMRVGIPTYPTEGAFEPTVRVRWRDGQGPHEVRTTLSLPYAQRTSDFSRGRAGDVLHYVSLLGTITAVHRAIDHRDAAGLDAMSAAASEQARAMTEFADERRDRVMGAQARLLRELLATARAGW